MPLPKVLQSFRTRPSMFIRKVDFNNVTSFLQGFETGQENPFLLNFATWLKSRTVDGHNMTWSQLVLFVAFPENKTPWQLVDSNDEGNNRIAIDALFDLLDQFFDSQPE